MITVSTLFLIINVILFILILTASHLKKVKLFIDLEDGSAMDFVSSVIFVISLISILIQVTLFLVNNWNETIG